MSVEDILLLGAVLCLGFIAGATIYFEMASLRKHKRLSAGYGPEERLQRPKTRTLSQQRRETS